MKSILSIHTSHIIFVKYVSVILLLFASLCVSCTNEKVNKKLEYAIVKGKKNTNSNLLILLHGMNSNTETWAQFERYIPEETLVVAAQGIFQAEKNAYYWYDIDFNKTPFTSNTKQMIESSRRIVNLIQEITKKYRINKKNVTIAGFSQGAILSLNIALMNPDLVNGVGVFSGVLPYDIDDRMANDIENLPIFITHGSVDESLKIGSAFKMKSFLIEKKASVKMVIENSGHTITTKQFKDFVSWSLKLKKK